MSNSYEEKQEAKRERYAERAEKLRADAERLEKAARSRASHIPMGQPILRGHHSERKHRRDLDKINRDTDRALESYRKAEHYERKARSYGNSGAISADDPEAVTKLQAKLARLETQREDIKTSNKAARKAGLPTTDAYGLTNLGATIRQVRERIKTLEAEKARAAKAAKVQAPVIQCEGFTIEECVEDNRLRFIFEGKPSAEIRAIMKAHGFRWAPSVCAWQRQLTENARMQAGVCQRRIEAL